MRQRAALHALLAAAEPRGRRRRRRTRRGRDVPRLVSEVDVISYLRSRQITLTYHPRSETLQADAPHAVTTVIGRAS